MSNQLECLDRLLQRLDERIPKQLTEDDWKSFVAFRWRHKNILFDKLGFLQALKPTSNISFGDLQYIDRQKNKIYTNTKYSAEGKPANNVLLAGARAIGKSSLIKVSLNEFSAKGLRLVEVDKEYLTDLLADRFGRFIIFCDDLSFLLRIGSKGTNH